ncbi:MAG: hypothetical protein AAFO70_09700 [Pseudomonadota bacterium]
MKSLAPETHAMRSIVILATFATALAAAPAAAKTLSNSEILETVSGKTVRLETRWGSFPLIYRTNKSVTGNGEALGLARFFAPKETGTWRARGGKLCQTFPTWYKGRENCFTLTKTGPSTLNWVRDDGYSGTASISN